MTEFDRRDLYIAVLDKYGITAQTLMLAEECAELVKAASKCCRYIKRLEPGDSLAMTLVNELIEEMADVEIVVEQMQTEYYITRDQIEAVKEKKLIRLEQRVAAVQR